MSDIFISYTHDDHNIARDLANRLNREGWSVFWDRRIPVGSTWDEIIEKELNDARVVVVLWSKKSVASKWVRTEAEYALNRKILVPAFIEDVEFPLRFQSLQTADISNWKSFEPDTEGMQMLIEAITSIGNLKIRQEMEATIIADKKAAHKPSKANIKKMPDDENANLKVEVNEKVKDETALKKDFNIMPIKELPDKRNVQKEIVKAIGENEGRDYILSPENHIRLYKQSIPFLAKLLSKSEILYIFDKYVRMDNLANKAQNKFRILSIWASRFVFLTITFSTTLVISGSFAYFAFFKINMTWFPSWMMNLSTIAAIIFSAIYTTIIIIIKKTKSLEKWQECRAEAEEIRIKYFKRIVDDKDIKKPDEYLTVLEYFRRYQLDVQLGFCAWKTCALDKKADTTLINIGILAVLFIVINGIAGIMGLQWTWIAVISITLQTYSFIVNNKELTDQNSSNSDIYSKISEELISLRSQIDDVRSSILNEEHTILANYVNAVHELISTKDRQWLKSMKTAGSALEKLDKQLNESKESNKN